VQFSIFLRDFEMRDENGKKGKIVAALFATCSFFLAHLSVRTRDTRLNLDVR
jgi:hypothetical protein